MEVDIQKLFCQKTLELEVMFGVSFCSTLKGLGNILTLNHLVYKLYVKVLCTSPCKISRSSESSRIVNCLFEQIIFPVFSTNFDVEGRTSTVSRLQPTNFRFEIARSICKWSSKSPRNCHIVHLTFQEPLWRFYATRNNI